MVATASSSYSQKQETRIKKTISWILNVGVNGLGPLPSAEEVALNHLKQCNDDKEKAINSIIRWKTTHGAAGGFAIGLGGILTIPVALPTSIATSYAVGANTIAAIAYIRGYDLKQDQVQTAILCCLLGKGMVEKFLKEAGVKLGQKFTQQLLQKIPGKLLIEINKKVGFRLITKAGKKGVFNLMKVVPVVGGVVGAAFDGAFVNSCGKIAKRIF